MVISEIIWLSECMKDTLIHAPLVWKREERSRNVNLILEKMVTIIGTETRMTKAGKEFHVMVLQGDIEVAISKDTGKPYLTARKTSIPCTFDETIAKSLVGHQLPGGIERIEVEQYEFKVPSTGKKIKLTHSYQYSKEPASVLEVVG
jgi:hypothetical protein